MATPVPLNLIPDNLKPRPSNAVPLDMIPDNLKPKAPAPAPNPATQQAIAEVGKQRAQYTQQLQENAARKNTAIAQLEERLGPRNKSNDSQYRSWLNQYEIRERNLQAELKALGGKEQFIAKEGRAPYELSLGEKIVEPLRTAGRTAIESTAQLAGLAGVFGKSGEEFAKTVEGYGKRGAEAIGLGQPAEVTEALQFDPTMQDVEFIAGGAGSTVPYLIGGGAKAAAKGVGAASKAVRGGSNVFLGAVASGQGATQAREQMDAYEKETGEKVGPLTRQFVQLGGGIIGLSELGVTEGLIARLPQNLRATATSKIMNVASKVGMGRIAPAEAKAAIKATIDEIESTAFGRVAMRGLEEAGQEAGAQFAQNVQERLAYNKDKQLSEDVAANAAAGFIIGGGIRAGTEAVQKAFPGGKEEANAAREALRKQKALESIDAAIPDPKDPNTITRQKLDILSVPDANGNVVVRQADGRLVRMSVETLESMRASTDEAVPAGIFTKDMISGRLINAAGEKPNGQTTAFVEAINRKLSNDLALGRPQAAADYISSLEGRFSRVRRAQANQEAATQGTSAIQDPALRVVYEAKSILNDYRAEYGKAQAQPGVTVGAPAPTTSLAQILELNQQARDNEGPMRQGLLTRVAMDPNITDKHAAFDEALADYGLDDTTPNEYAALLDVMRMESAFETAAAEGETQNLKSQQVEREDIVGDTLSRRNFDIDQKISKIEADLLQARQEPLTEDEIARIQRRAFTMDVFGPGGEYELTTEEEPSDEELAAFAQAENEYEVGVQGGPEVVPQDMVPAELKPIAPEEIGGVQVTKVAPGVAQGVKETRRGQMGTTQGRPVEGAAELTPGMQDEQLLTERLGVLRNNNRLSDQDVGDVLRMMRVPTTKADFDALPDSQRKRWEAAINQQLLINQRSEELNNTPNPKQKAKIKAALKVLNEQLDEMRGGIANAAGREAMARVTKRQADIRRIEDAYKAKQITKADRDTAIRALRVQPTMGTVLSMRLDAASEMITNPQADVVAADLTEAANVARGTEEILAALQQAVADGKMTQNHADFATWVLKNNPNLTRYASLFVSNYTGQGYAGQYEPISRIIEVVAGAPSATTTHEILHHAERLMPESAQDAIYDLWETHLKRERKKASGDVAAFFDNVHKYYFENGDPKLFEAAYQTIESGTVPVSFYQYLSPSEFWAENATDILRQRYDVKDSVIGRIKQWLKEFASQIGGFVGMPTRSTVIQQLNQLANTTGTAKSERLIVGNEGSVFMPLGGRNAEYPDEMLDPTDLGMKPNPNVSREDRAGIMASLQGLLGKFSKTQSAIIRKLNYSYQDIVDYDKQLAEMYGVEQLPNNMAVSHKAELLNASRSGRQISLERNFIQPILKKMAELGVEEQDMGMYLWARGAKDRNAMVRERNAAYPEGGSGMTDAEADAILKEFALRGLEPKLKEIAKMHDRLVDFMINTRVKEGLLTRQQADMARKMQPFYTPLKGFAAAGDMQTMGDEEAHSDEAYQKHLGIRRSEYMKSEGRVSMPFNPLYMLFSDAKHLIQRSSVNRVGQQLLDNLINDPEANADVATYYTDSDPKIRVIPSENIEYPDGTPVNTNMRAERGKYLVVKKDGVPYYIEFKDTDAGQALKRAFDNMTPQKLEGFMKAWVKGGNVMKSLLTRFSPPYLPRALLRDVQDAVTNAYAAETEKGNPAFGKKLGSKVAANISMLSPTGRLINGALFRYVNGLEPETAEQAEMLLLLEQMIEDGGSPGHAVIHDLELLTDDATKSLKQMKALQNKNPTAFAKEAITAIPKVLDATSQMIDYKARLATYVAALEEGIDREGAARLALNSSLNLTRRGEWARTLDSLYFFFSPSAESARRLKRLAFNSSNGRKIILAQMAMGALLTMWNAYMGGEDDDRDGRPNYMDLPDAVKQTSLVIMTGPKNDDYVPIPLGFMLGFPTYIGQKISEAAMGAISTNAAAISIMDAVKSVGAAAVTTLSPVKPQGEDATQLVTSVVPNLVKPFADTAINRNHFNSPIYQQKFDADRAASSLGREDTERVWKWIARSLNDATNGSGAVGGGFDRQPEWYRYILESYLGGGYRTAKDTYKFVTEDNKEDKTLAQRLPIVRAYVGKGGEYVPMNQYFMKTESAPFYGHPGMGALVRQKEYEPEDFKESRKKFPLETDWRVMELYKQSKSDLDEIGRDRREELLGVKDGERRRKIVDRYRKKQEVVYKQFNRRWNAIAKGVEE